MCGIFGWQFRPNFRPPLVKRAVLSYALGRENLSRGKDSWGYYLTEQREIIKGVGEIVKNTREAACAQSVIGHTRHGTVGAATYENAHPFEIGNIIGSHNGGIGNHKEINDLRKAVNLHEYTCDSMHLIDAIDQGLEQCENLTGWGAVEWIDLNNPQTIRLCRISSRGDLNIAQCQEGIIWSSSEYDLKRAMYDSGFKGILFNVETNKVYEVHNGHLMVTDQRIYLKNDSPSQSSFGGHWEKDPKGGGHWVQGGASSYGSQGSDSLERARREFIEKNRKHHKKNSKRTKTEEIPIVVGEMIVKSGDRFCTMCLNPLTNIGTCPEGHNASTIAAV